MNKNKNIFFLWLFLVVAWNFLVPGARPIYDVLAAVVLSLLSKLLKQQL